MMFAIGWRLRTTVSRAVQPLVRLAAVAEVGGETYLLRAVSFWPAASWPSPRIRKRVPHRRRLPNCSSIDA
jgi:hypothetical protein